MKVISDNTVSYRTILSASVAPQSAPHMFHYYFSEKIIQRGEKDTQVREKRPKYSSNCPKLNYMFPIYLSWYS